MMDFDDIGENVELIALLSVLCATAFFYASVRMVRFFRRTPSADFVEHFKVPPEWREQPLSPQPDAPNHAVLDLIPLTGGQSDPRSPPQDASGNHFDGSAQVISWDDVSIKINKSLSRYDEIVDVLSRHGAPVSQEFVYPNFSCVEQDPSSFILSIGERVPPRVINKLIQILEPYGLKAIDLTDYEAETIFVASHAKAGVLLDRDTISRLHKLEGKKNKYMKQIRQSRQLILGTHRREIGPR